MKLPRFFDLGRLKVLEHFLLAVVTDVKSFNVSVFGAAIVVVNNDCGMLIGELLLFAAYGALAFFHCIVL